MRLDALEIDDHILEKIEAVHGVPFSDVEEACYSSRRHVRRGREGLYKVFSRSDAGQYLLVVLAAASEGVWRVVTARSMTDQERRLYQRQMGD